MKNLILNLLGLLISLTAFAQKSEGVITYEVKVNMHRRLPKDQEATKSMIPEFQAYQMQLFFNKQESFYKTVEEDESDEESNNGGMRIVMRRPQSEIYLNFVKRNKVELREFMGKKFLIEDSLKSLAWKLNDENKTIQGYVCKKATYRNEERKQDIVAWYTESLPFSGGPELYHSLFGTILEIDVNQGETVILAKGIEFRPLKKDEIKIPSGGKKTSPEEFRKMVDDMMKQNGGSGIRIIRN